VLVERTLAIIHAAVAQAFFALLVSVALFTSQEWTGAPQQMLAEEGRRLRGLCTLTTAVLYLQLVLGAMLRHTGAYLDAHVLVAALVSMHVLWLAVRILRTHAEQPTFVHPAVLLCALLILQLSLGLGAYLVQFTGFALTVTAFARVGLTTAHVVVGSLMLVTSVWLTLRAYRVLIFPEPAVGGSVVSEQVPL